MENPCSGKEMHTKRDCEAQRTDRQTGQTDRYSYWELKKYRIAQIEKETSGEAEGA